MMVEETPDRYFGRKQDHSLAVQAQTSQKSSRLPSVAKNNFPKDFFNGERRTSLTNQVNRRKDAPTLQSLSMMQELGSQIIGH